MRGTQTQRDDRVMTPDWLARSIIEDFRPAGRILEPCCGDGAFLRYLPSGALWCELDRGRDFLHFEGRVDWIVTNPPWSRFKPFLIKSLQIADNIVFLVPIVHFWGRARLRAIASGGFGFVRIKAYPEPATFPQMGFQLGATHLQRGYGGPTQIDLSAVDNEQIALL